MSQPTAPRTGFPWSAIGWLLAATLLAAGAAGIVAGADHSPGDATRPELTWQADLQLDAALVALDAPITALSGDVDLLADAARSALIDLVGRNDDALDKDLARGSVLAASIERRSGEIRALVAALPNADRPGALGGRSLERLAATRDALAAVEPLPFGWRNLAEGVAPAVRLAGMLDEHDRLTFEATQFGIKGQFPAALNSLEGAAAQLASARKARDELGVATDVSTLSAWIDVAAAYDDALGALYLEMSTSKGKLTERATAALSAVEAAQRRLPRDTGALAVIMSDIARGGLNQGAISIEQARGDLAAAIAALH
jgi:hypothetical protein